MQSVTPDADEPRRAVIAIATDESVTDVVIDAICRLQGDRRENTSYDALDDLDPLYDAVDPDALERLFRGRETSGRVTFRHAGCTVEVVDGEYVVARSAAGDGASSG